MARLLEMNHITKRFGSVKALDDVSLQLDAGEVLSLCGENGSGKSTLMKVLCGLYPYGEYEGEVRFAGEELRAATLRDSERRGIVIIHQELALVRQLTVLENIFLGAEIARFGVVDDETMTLRCRQLLARVRLDVDPATRVSELSPGQQQLVEIARALNKQVRILVLDEPTSSLTAPETAVLLEIINNLREHGIACIYISHKLSEVKAISDTICVIRDGKPIGSRPAAAMSEDDIITMMVGREMSAIYPSERHTPGEEILRVENLTAWHPLNRNVRRVDNVSFSLRRGEILGIAGLVGAGRSETVRCLYGDWPGRWQGRILLDGQPVTINSCAQAIALGIAMVPEDRKKDGIVPLMAVGKNISLAALDQFSGPLTVLDEAAEQEAIQQGLARLRVKTASADLAIDRLSGGNQQKAIIARCLQLNPRILILDEPTRGIDIGARVEIYRLIAELVRQGIAIIVISSELPEVLGLSDRVLVMHEGQIKADLLNHNLSQEQVMDAALRSPHHA